MDILHSPWFLPKNQPFPHMFFFCKKSHKETFFDILDRIKEKRILFDNKRKVLKNCKKSTFCKGVSPWFFQKIDLFLICFFLAKKARKKHYFIFWIGKNRKEYFLDHKREVLKNSKKSTFCKGVSPWFLSKN